MPYKDPEAAKEYHKKYRLINREKLNAKERDRMRDPVRKQKHSDYGRKYRTENREKFRDMVKSWRERNRDRCKQMPSYSNISPEVKKVRSAFWSAIQHGKIERKGECEICGDCYCMEAHHEDYSKPFDVVWLCKLCHAGIHREKRL